MLHYDLWYNFSFPWIIQINRVLFFHSLSFLLLSFSQHLMLLSDDLDIVMVVDIHDLIISMWLVHYYRYSTSDEYM